MPSEGFFIPEFRLEFGKKNLCFSPWMGMNSSPWPSCQTPWAIEAQEPVLRAVVLLLSRPNFSVLTECKFLPGMFYFFSGYS